MITLAGDGRQVIFRGPTNPMTYPEVNLMMFVHGDRYVNDIKVIGTRETTNSEELQDLRIKYGKSAHEAFPGQRPRLPLQAPDDIPRDIEPEFDPLASAPEKETVAAGEEAAPARRRKPRKIA